MPKKLHTFKLDSDFVAEIDAAAARLRLDRTAFLERALRKEVRREPSLRAINAKLNRIIRKLGID